MSVESDASSSDFIQGLGILLLAQFMSAYAGAYTEDTYAEYKANWTENLFYSHALGMPLFLPLAGTLHNQYRKLADTPHVSVRQYLPYILAPTGTTSEATGGLAPHAYPETMPKGILLLFTNAVTQLACISGVNLLSAKSSAVTVTIVLNIRKLVSFIMSTLLFGHQLNAMMVLGATLVFGSGALYGYETSWRIPTQKKKKKNQAAANGKPSGNGGSSV